MLPIIFLLLLVVSSCLANGAGPVGKIEIKKIDACDNSNYQLKIQFDSSAGDGKTFNIQFKTTRTINENWTVSIHIFYFVSLFTNFHNSSEVMLTSGQVQHGKLES